MAKSNRNKPRKKPAPGWVWMLFGLSLGLVVAAGVYLRGASSSKPPGASASALPKTAPAADRQQTKQSNRAAKTGEKAQPEEPRFDFYEMLPKYEVVIPEVETATNPAARSKPIEEPGSYVLQVGSFSAAADAERLKANLALLGIESRVQRVTIDADVFHRVRIGPIADLSALNRIRKQLRDARIEPMVMKVP